MPCTGEIQSHAPEVVDASVSHIKGSDYYKPYFVPPAEHITVIDPKDHNTPDEWVPRHPELIRLTGRHPFNVEPPPYRLFDHGFITPASLHYVRNHGAAPRLDAAIHKLRVGGLVTRPLEMTMDFLRGGTFKEVTIPVTLVCAGNRRKEENMIRQGLGFSWGPAAVSNAMWTGVWLKDILEYAGIKSYSDGAHHVCMVGADKLPNGYYGTSIRREVAIESSADVLIAYKCNGEELTPDHGYPVRVIIPGYIGGRMIKWLTDITVTSDESDNHYHYFDNRVLPPQVDAEKALAEGWWYKPQYIINELNINSAVIYPRHDELLPLGGPNAPKTYTVKGYAYSGGGLAINRAEVSLDGGATWELAILRAPEKPRHMGKYWCWVFWELEVDVSRIMGCKEIMCRAWQGQNTQPKDLTWNLLGMMNNCHFRCKIHPARSEDGTYCLRFEHPTQAGPTPGGWMVKTETPSAAPVVKKEVVSSTKRLAISKAELSKHESEKDCWIAVEGKVYDVTKFLDDHPGGGDSILLTAGQDSTDEFNALHGQKARDMLADYYIGDMEGEGGVVVPSNIPAAKVDLITLNPRQKVTLKLASREELTHNTRRLRFALPTSEHRLGLPCGKHFFLSGKWKDEFVMRAYTPTTGDDVLGYVELVIKVYFPNERFPVGGKMSQLLNSLKVGDTMDFKGPLGEIHYTSKGAFTYKGVPRSARRLGMICGGTGVTPMFQVAKYILADPTDETEVSLLVANVSEDDILLQDELTELVTAHPTRFKVHYTVDKIVGDKAAWQGSVGFVSDTMIAAHLPAALDDTVVFMCGPPPMLKFACVPNLQKLGHTDANIIAF